MASDPILLRYDAYELNSQSRKVVKNTSICGIPYLYKDNDGTLWASDCSIHEFNSETNTFSSYEITKSNQIIHTMIDDNHGNIWLGGDEFGLKLFDKKTKKVIASYKVETPQGDSLNIYSISADFEKNALWLLTSSGIVKFDINTKKSKIINDFNNGKYEKSHQRDISFDRKNNFLWVATVSGLIRINTNTYETKKYTASSKPNSLTISHTTTTFLDSNNNLWVGLEKEGLCLHRSKHDDFLCLKSSFQEKNKIPAATIEDIYEDTEGSLWLAVNHYGVVRITPDLEKIKTLKDQFSNSIPNYFPNTFDAIIRDNGDIWLATDGGGINIYNYKNNSIRNIKHDPGNPNSLPANSVISMSEDEYGNIWAGFWAGGISKINPNTMDFTNYLTEHTHQGLAGNNVFVVEADHRGGVWISIWGYGLQYFHINENRFESFINAENQTLNVNKEVVGIAFHDNKAWIVGNAGLEYFDYSSKKFQLALTGLEYSLSSIYIDSLEKMYLGSRDGLIRFNSKNKETTRFFNKDGLVDNNVFYLTKDQNNKLWIATGNGISIFDEANGTFKSLTIKDGLVSNELSTYGEFFKVNGKIYSTGRLGVNIIDPNDLPWFTKKPKTYLYSVLPIKSADSESIKNMIHDKNPKIPYELNSLEFKFTSLSYIFPENNRFRYRLIGWKDEYAEVSSHERTMRFTNLNPGEYTFEVQSANSSGIWDDEGEKYTFTILLPWYSTWWAILLIIISSVSVIYFAIQFKLAVKIRQEKEISAKIEKELSQKVKEKTFQLQQNTKQLEVTSHKLATLNAELESRVEQRTAELKIEINERSLAEKKLFHMAFHDSLTGLPNRQWLIKKIDNAIQESSKNKDFRFCLMFLDGDRFKQINDTHGHIVGDQLLISSAKRLADLLSGNQVVTRLGGDEFTIFCCDITSDKSMLKLAENIIEAFKLPFCIENNIINFHMSIGLVICDDKYQFVSNVLRDADIAMYRAKEVGKGNYKVFDKKMRNITLSLAELEKDLYEAIEKKQFYLMYQPIIELQTNIIIGFEALIRWQHPKKGLISPVNFIPLAEETGLIWQIGAWVLEESLRQMSLWHQLDIGVKPSISVNISTGQLRNLQFLSLLDSCIKKYDIDSSYLKLELTESVLMENNETMNTLINELNKRHIDLAIDDFGTGYSSLAYLNEIPVQQIKIDKKFIDAIDSTANGEINEDALEIAKATISLGKSLRKKITAEGVESRQQMDALRKFNCDLAQGYYISKPLHADDAQAVLAVDFETNVNNIHRVKNREDLLAKYKKIIASRSNRLRDRIK